MNTSNKLNWKKSKHGQHQLDYYSQNKQKFLLANQKYRAKLKTQKSPKPRSLFLQTREQKFINCLDKHHLVVTIPRFLKTKHPIIQGWNKPNWWWQTKIPQLLAKGYNYFGKVITNFSTKPFIKENDKLEACLEQSNSGEQQRRQSLCWG